MLFHVRPSTSKEVFVTFCVRNGRSSVLCVHYGINFVTVLFTRGVGKGIHKTSLSL